MIEIITGDALAYEEQTEELDAYSSGLRRAFCISPISPALELDTVFHSGLEKLLRVLFMGTGMGMALRVMIGVCSHLVNRRSACRMLFGVKEVSVSSFLIEVTLSFSPRISTVGANIL